MSEQPSQPKKPRPKKPKNPNLRCKAYKFRISPTKKQRATLEWTLRRCKELYNAALQERRDAYQMCGVSIFYGVQADQLPEIKRLREEYQDIHSQVQQDVLKRLDKAFDAFFRRIKNGETPGYPRFKSGDRYDSFTYPQGGYEIIGKRLHLSKIGHVKIKRHREITGQIKICTIKREGEQWYAVFSTEDELDLALTFHPSEEAVGIDLGVKTFAVLSNGEAIAHPRFYRHSEEKIKEGHRKIHRRKKGSHRRARAKKELSRLSRKVRNRRRDFLHKASRKLVNQYGTLVFEDLHVDNMTKTPAPKQDEQGKYVPNGAAAKGGLNKSILDAGWGAFVTLCNSKAEEAGCCVVKVAPHNTSQACSGCGGIVEKDLSVRWHSCPHCGTELDRDHNAAKNILHRYHNEKQDGAGSVPHKPLRVRSAGGTVSKPLALAMGCFTDIPDSWLHLVGDELHKPYFAKLEQFVDAERKAHIVFPPEQDVFNALKYTPYEQVNVLLLGQDPYHDDNQAHGLCFSVRPGIKPPPSLMNMFKELRDDVGFRIPNNGYLVPWAQQGMLMLNAILTVRAHTPNSHKNHGWETFTDAIIKQVNEKDSLVVFVLWGSYAQKKIPLIDTTRHTVVQSAHPSPLSARSGFFGSKPFSRINQALKEAGKAEIDWQLPDL